MILPIYNMITITDKHDCCGCGACAQRCPRQCITMQPDAEGFIYPEVDASRCVDCGVCEMVCPLANPRQRREPEAVLAVKNRNSADRADSSSGGVFIALARNVVASGGVVYGAVFDDGWQVVHTYADTEAALRPMMGSKYVQSSIRDAYSSAERHLKAGRKVMFTGTPCQTAGLLTFLRRDYDNLLLVDILCHGVPSPDVWRRYIEETFIGQDAAFEITAVSFRDKNISGWAHYNIVISGRRRGSGERGRVLSALPSGDNLYMRGFTSDVYLRPSCHRCVCKHGASGSDLTIADYWGVERYMPDFDDGGGVSLVQVYTDRGRQALSGIDADVRQAITTCIETYNGGFSSAPPESRRRARFFADIASGLSFAAATDRALHVPAYLLMVKKVKMKLKKILKSIAK